jgi:hypothetical protein
MWWLAVGAGVALGATAIAWMCDSATEAEESRHRDLLGYINKIESELSRFDVKLEESSIAALRKSIIDVLRQLEDGCAEFKANKGVIHSELNEFKKYIENEIKSDELGPYRRRALLKNRCLIEEADTRLKAYMGYLEYYRNTILSGWKNKVDSSSSLDTLTEILQQLEAPSPILPDDYLYVGKVVLVNDSELDSSLPYESRLHLTGKPCSPFNISQKKVFELSKDEDGYSPVQVLSEKSGKYGKRIFYGCAARGNAWLGMENGIEFYVKHKIEGGKAYKVEAFEGILRARLPSHLIDNPFVELIVGQRIKAWFHDYELLLGWRTQGGAQDQRKDPELTMDSEDITRLAPEPVYLLMKDHISESVKARLGVEYSEDWLLINSDINVVEGVYRGNISLLNGNTKVICDVDCHNGHLVATSIESCSPSGNEFDIDVKVIPIISRLWGDYLKGEEGVNAICGVAQQIKTNSESSSDRAESSQRFERWRQIVEYQKGQNQFTLEFSIRDVGSAEPHEVIVPFIDNAVDSDLETSESWIKRYHEVEKNIMGSRKPFCKLEFFCNDKSLLSDRWRNLGSTGDRYPRGISLDFSSNKNIILKLSPRVLKFISDPKVMLRLTLINLDSSLQRQQEALEDFRSDRLAEHMLKEILSIPGSYTSMPDLSWNNHFSSFDRWQNKMLTARQKQVIQSALSDKYVSIIQGPPGTAKTTSIVEMLFQIYQHNPDSRVLLVSQQHAAVDNALKRFLEIDGDLSGGVFSDILRIGPENKMDDAVKPYALGTIINDFKKTCLENVQNILSSHDHLMKNLACLWSDFLSTEDEKQSELISLFINSRRLVGATCVGLAGKLNNIDKLKFDIVIIDEAGRSTVPELLIPINRARKLILIGDHFQLPPSIAPMLREDEAKEILPFIKQEFLETSFFELLYEKLPENCKSRLEEQFRMPAPIGNLVAKLFYTIEGKRKLFNGFEKVEDDFLYKGQDVIQWINCYGSQEREKKSKSLFNKLESDYVLDFLEKTDQFNQVAGYKSVAVITPYSAQKRLINNKLRQSEYFKADEYDSRVFVGNILKVRVDTVDSFQGSEAELVLYSVVRTYGDLKFILDWKRLNVACSRAKENLVFFGNRNFLEGWESNSGERNLFREVIAQIN